MSPVKSFVEYDYQVVQAGHTYIAQPALDKSDPSSSQQEIPDSQSEDSDCGFAAPSTAHGSERHLADRSCTPSTTFPPTSDSASHPTLQVADSHPSQADMKSLIFA